MKSVGLIILSLDLGLVGGVAVPSPVDFGGLPFLGPGGWVEEDEEEEAEDDRILPTAEESMLGFTVADESDGASPDT